MRRTAIVLVLCITCLFWAPSTHPAEEGTLTVRWYGQSCFLVTTTAGTRILTDPVDFKGYHLPEGFVADIVTVSHEHPDHNAVGAVSGNPEVLRGCTEGNRKVIEVDRQIEDVRIYSVSSYHDPGHHGVNAVFVFEFDGLRLAHLGDIGTTLTDAQIKAIGPLDMLMIPMGGLHTIGTSKADEIIAQLSVERIVFPMHFKTAAFASLPYSAADFLQGKQRVRKLDLLVLDPADLPLKREYVVFEYK